MEKRGGFSMLCMFDLANGFLATPGGQSLLAMRMLLKPTVAKDGKTITIE
jgi:hypothetical protein